MFYSVLGSTSFHTWRIRSLDKGVNLINHFIQNQVNLWQLQGGKYPFLRPFKLTDDKLHSKLVASRFVGTIEGDLDLELLSSTDDERVRVVKRGVVLGLVDLIRHPHHVHIHDVKKLWMDRKTAGCVQKHVDGYLWDFDGQAAY